jgi:hypothetical protein
VHDAQHVDLVLAEPASSRATETSLRFRRLTRYDAAGTDAAKY